jgi:hypothetical protein
VNLTSGSIDSAKKEGKGAEEEKERNCIRQRKPVFCHVQLSFFMASFFGTVIQPMYRTSPLENELLNFAPTFNCNCNAIGKKLNIRRF